MNKNAKPHKETRQKRIEPVLGFQACLYEGLPAETASDDEVTTRVSSSIIEALLAKSFNLDERCASRQEQNEGVVTDKEFEVEEIFGSQKNKERDIWNLVK